MKSDELELIKRAKKKDEEAFNSLIQLYDKYLFSIAFSYMENEHDAKEAIQETLWIIYKKLWMLLDETKFKSWITVIMRNVCTEMLSKRSIKEEFTTYDEETINNVVDETDQYLEFESNERFYKIIDFLNEDDKIITIMTYSLNLKPQQIAKIMNLKEGTVRMRICRIKSKIKDKYGKDLSKYGY